MKTDLAAFMRGTPDGEEADAILRSCVHCGFCTATCPTYQLLGDELDGPRGRIYLIKEMLEGKVVTQRTQQHLDRCLLCRACETTCPSGVNYHRLLHIGRKVMEEQVARSLKERLTVWLLCNVLPRPQFLRALVRIGQWIRFALPAVLAQKLPQARSLPCVTPAPSVSVERRMIALPGCVQSTLTPETNAAARRVLARLGIALIEPEGASCCGALRYHLGAEEGARENMRQAIDAWWPLIEKGEVEAIVMTASGCGAHLRDYGSMLKDDPDYAFKAARVAELSRDVSELVLAEQAPLKSLLAAESSRFRAARVAFHAPCTLQHGQKIRGGVESLLAMAGYVLVPVSGSHLCCGSAGTYSLTQPVLAKRLRDNKLAALDADKPEIIVTANVGCQTHLQSGTSIPVRHWIELLDERLGE